MFKKLKNGFKGCVSKVKNAVVKTEAKIAVKAYSLVEGTAAEAYVDTGIKILIAVVVGALLLAGLYALFGDTIMPTVTEKVNELFNYAG